MCGFFLFCIFSKLNAVSNIVVLVCVRFLLLLIFFLFPSIRKVVLRYILDYVLHERARCSLLVLSMVTFRQPIFFCSLQVSVTKHSYKIVFIVQNRNYLGKYLYYQYCDFIYIHVLLLEYYFGKKL